MNTRQRLREARARYIDARQYQRSAPVAYWVARAEYLCCIRAAELALGRKRFHGELPSLLRRQAE